MHNPTMVAATDKPCFVLELALRVDSTGRKRLARDFDFARQLVNATLGTALGRRTQMRQTPGWKAACVMPKGKERTVAFQNVTQSFGISSAYDFEKILQAHAKASGRAKQVNANVKQTLADNLWRSWSAWLFEGKGKPRFKGMSRGLHSIRGKDNKQGIIWKPEILSVRYAGNLYRVHILQRDTYAREAIRDGNGWRKAKYCAIVRKTIHEKLKYFVQITFEGNPPTKIIPATSDLAVGIDPSMTNMTLAFSNGVVEKVKTSPSVENRAKEIRRLQRAMDRSKRATNPDNFNANGTVKKGAQTWVYSKSYQRLRKAVADLQRRRADARKNEHGQLINWILQNAGEIRVEDNSWKAMQRGWFGKSVGDGAPSEFVARLLSKADRAGSKAFKMNPRNIKPTQCDLLTGEFTKHTLWERRVRLGESDLFIDRDAMAALNLLFHSPETELRDAEGLKHILETSKSHWLNAGVLVEVKVANRLSKRELRHILRNGMKPISVERLHSKKFLNGVCDAGSKKVPHGSFNGSESLPNSETPSLQ